MRHTYKTLRYRVIGILNGREISLSECVTRAEAKTKIQEFSERGFVELRIQDKAKGQ